jgi:RimJ/RimL family protein N-acetyltransferase
VDTLQYLEQFRQVKTLKSGVRVLLRPLVPDDADALVALFQTATPEDITYLRHDVTDKDLVKSWACSVDLLNVFPLVAEINNRIVGDATLHFGEGYRRHLTWLRIFLSPDSRRQGIGSLMLNTLSSIARRLGMNQVIAEVVSTQVQMQKALESLNFQKEYRHRDYFMTQQGETLDMDVYILRLVEPGGQF